MQSDDINREFPVEGVELTILPGVVFVPPADPNRLSHDLYIRVPDCQAACKVLKARGAEFLTPPID
jgi:hypothetical protein